MISIEDFRKVELRVALVEEAERVQGSEKLIKLKISLGEERRQVIAGIGKAYEPDSLIGKKIIIAANLEPRVLMGEESQGMLLAADAGDGTPVILIPEKSVPPGTLIK